MSAGTVLRLDNVSYQSFPTASELLSLSSNLASSFIDFIRSLGIHGRDQTAHFLSSSPEEVDHLCRKCHLNIDVDQGDIDRAVERRRHWQREILGGLTHKFEVNLQEILIRAKERTKFYRLDTIAKEVKNLLCVFLKRFTGGHTLPKATINEERVNEILANCHLVPIRAWSEARENPGYIRTLVTEAFPHTPTSLIAKYLFTEDSPTPQHITNYCIYHRINRFEITHNPTVYHEEQIAFAKWVGCDVKAFIADQVKKHSSWHRYL